MDSSKDRSELTDGCVDEPTLCSIALLGGFSVRVQGSVLALPTRKTAALLAMLSFRAGQEFRREWLIAELWPDAFEESARANLRQALLMVRKLLEEAGFGPEAIAANRQTISLKETLFRTDVLEFEALVTAAGQSQGGERLERLRLAVDAYSGSLLLGFDEPWVMPERLRLERLFVTCAVDLAGKLSEVCLHSQALPYAQRAAEADPFSESARIAVVGALLGLRRTSEARLQARDLERALQAELGVAPSASTRETFETWFRAADGDGGEIEPAPPAILPKGGGARPLARILIPAGSLLISGLLWFWVGKPPAPGGFIPKGSAQVNITRGTSSGAFPWTSPAVGPPAVERRTAASQSECFIENRGQWDSQAVFLARSAGIDSWVTRGGIVYDFHRYQQRFNSREPGATLGHVIKMSFVGTSKEARIAPVRELRGRLNYFIGANRRKWATGVRRFAETRAEQIYGGVATRYYFDGGAPRYDLIVAPNADPSQIRMRFEGAGALSVLPSGALRIDTSLGPIEQRGLFVYQRAGPKITKVKCRMVTDGKSVRFQVAGYDRSKPLVIDPLVFSTYVSGGGYDDCDYFSLDSTGNIVVAGHASATEFPIAAGPYRIERSGNVRTSNLFVAKLSQDGSSLLFGAYVGGTGTDRPYALALDSSGSPIVTGTTWSNDFPVTSGAFQKRKSTAVNTGFVLKLRSDGQSLLFSTYLGGSGGAGEGDGCGALALDSSDNIVVSGNTHSSDFPTTPGTYQTAYKGRSVDCLFVSKLRSDGKALIFSTLLRDRRGHQLGTACTCLALDSSGNIVAAGYTGSSDFPVTVGAFQISP